MYRKAEKQPTKTFKSEFHENTKVRQITCQDHGQSEKQHCSKRLKLDLQFHCCFNSASVCGNFMITLTIATIYMKMYPKKIKVPLDKHTFMFTKMRKSAQIYRIKFFPLIISSFQIIKSCIIEGWLLTSCERRTAEDDNAHLEAVEPEHLCQLHKNPS